MAIDLSTRVLRTLYELEPGWSVSMTNCSADGRSVFFGCWEDLSDRIPTDLLRGYVGFEETWAARPMSRIIRVAVEGSAHTVEFEESYWIGHVNTSPTRPELLTFCHEGPWDKVDNRIWGLESGTGRVWKIRPTVPGEIVGHEYWFRDGVHVGYHGRTISGRSILGRILYDGSERVEADFPGQTGHIFSLDSSLVVGDGGGVIRVWKQADDGYGPARVLCRHDSTMNIQQTHPHPIISPDGRYVVFSSDRSGYGNVYAVPLAEYESLPIADR